MTRVVRRKRIWAKDDPKIGEPADECAFVSLSTLLLLPVFVEHVTSPTDDLDIGEKLLDLKAGAKHHGVEFLFAFPRSESLLCELDDGLGSQVHIFAM